MPEPAPADTLNAFLPGDRVTLAPQAAEGPLHGLQYGLKDLFDVEGHITGCGNPDWMRSHGPATRTSPVAVTLAQAGAAMVGKTITDELAFSLHGENHHYGTPVNGAAPDRVPGGSSSGSAAAVAGAAVDFAIGTDTGGSIRAPASYCGLWGMRPSHGAISLEGCMPLAPSFDTVGWFARDADTFARVGRVLLGADDDQVPLEGPVHVVTEAVAMVWDQAREEAQALIDRAGAVLGSPLPVAITEGDGDLEAWRLHFSALQWREIWDTHRDWITREKPVFGPNIAERFRLASLVPDADVAAAQGFRARLTVRLGRLLADGAILLMPTVPGAAPLKGLDGARVTDYRNRALRMLCLSGLTRIPQISIPLGQVDGAPFGFSLLAARGRDRALIDVAVRLAGA